MELKFNLESKLKCNLCCLLVRVEPGQIGGTKDKADSDRAQSHQHMMYPAPKMKVIGLTH